MTHSQLPNLAAALFCLAAVVQVPAASLTVNPRTLPEGATITITYVETSDSWPTESDTFTFEWGDATTNRYPNTTQSSFNLQHPYLDNGRGSGAITVTVTGENSGGARDTTVQNISVTNVPPTFNFPDELTIPAGQPLTNIVAFNDPGNDTFQAHLRYGDGSPSK